MHLSRLCNSELSRLKLCFFPSAGFPWADLQQCSDNFVAAICALDLHLVPGVCLGYLHVCMRAEESRANQWVLIINKLCNLTTFFTTPLPSPRNPRGCSYSSCWVVVHPKGSVWEQCLCSSQTWKTALHLYSFQLLGGHQHKAVCYHHGGDLLFTEDQVEKQIIWVSSADCRLQLYLVKFVSHKWYPEVLIKVK